MADWLESTWPTIRQRCGVPFPDDEGSYEVSDQGRVRSLTRVVVQSNGRRIPWKGRMLRLWPEKDGYLCVRLGQGPRYHVHVLVLEAFVGPRPTGYQALHINGDSGDPRLVNLRWGTRSENCLDLVRHGTHHLARRTVCPRGHALALPNLDPSNLKTDNGRACWACAKARRAVRYCRDRGYPLPDLQREADRQFRLIMSGCVKRNRKWR